MKYIYLVLFAFVFIQSVSAATISGTVYDMSFDRVNDVLVEIDTIPKQMFVATDGSYSFQVPEGTYVISAEKDDEDASEEITVEQDGDFIIDLLIFPSFAEEDALVEDINSVDIESDLDILSYKKDLRIYVLVLFAIVLFNLLFVFRKRVKTFLRKKLHNTSKKTHSVSDNHTETVLAFISSQGGRTTQREIRKEIPLSEAKISLLLAELAHDNKIKKFKTGRSNVVVLKDK